MGSAEGKGLSAAVIFGAREWEEEVHRSAPNAFPRVQAERARKQIAKDILAVERHGARTLRGLRARIASRLLVLAAAVSLRGARAGRWWTTWPEAWN